MRLFIAVNFPDEVKTALMKTVNEIGGRFRSAGLTTPQNLHLTLAFIGETNRVKDISAAIDATAATLLDIKPPVLLHLGSVPLPIGSTSLSDSKTALPRGFGMFGDLLYLSAYGSRDVAAAENAASAAASHTQNPAPSPVSDPVCEYANALAGKLRALGFNIERRPFRAHITLARGLDRAELERLGLDLKPPEMTVGVKKISLMKSERINGRVRYTEIYSREIR